MAFGTVMKEKKPTKKQAATAYTALKELRTILRSLYNLTAQSPSSEAWAETYVARQHVVDAYLQDNPLAKIALTHEREAAAKMGGSGNAWFTAQHKELVREAHLLVQKLPTYPDAPEGEAENKLRAVEALIKAKNAVSEAPDLPQHAQYQLLKSIITIVFPKEVLAAKKKEIEEEKKKIAAAKAAAKKAAEKAAKKKAASLWSGTAEDLMTLDQSPWHLVNVENPDSPGLPVGKMALAKLPSNAPITWGTCSIWMDKQHAVITGKPSQAFVHPEWLPMWKKWKHMQKVNELKKLSALAKQQEAGPEY